MIIKRVFEIIKRKLKKILLHISPTYKKVVNIESVIKKKDKERFRSDYLFWLSQNIPGEKMSDTKKRVFANMPAAEGVLGEIQEILNAILVRTDKICRNNSLDYWLMGGTLIGAIRHKGFIPWDGDIDIGMMRKDYEKLKECLKDDPYIEVVDCYNFNGYYRIPKIAIRDSDPRLVIDIIVFDYATSDFAPKNEENQLKYIWNEEKKIRAEYIKQLKNLKLKNLDVIGTNRVHNTKHFEELQQITDKFAKNCPYIDKGGDIVIWGTDNFTSKARDTERIYWKNKIFPLEELEFNGKMYKVPRDYMHMITREAGDIWELPPDLGYPKQFSMDKFEKHLKATKKMLNEEFAEIHN